MQVYSQRLDLQPSVVFHQDIHVEGNQSVHIGPVSCLAEAFPPLWVRQPEVEQDQQHPVIPDEHRPQPFLRQWGMQQNASAATSESYSVGWTRSSPGSVLTPSPH